MEVAYIGDLHFYFTDTQLFVSTGLMNVYVSSTQNVGNLSRQNYIIYFEVL